MYRKAILLSVGTSFLFLYGGCSSAERVESHSIMGRFRFLWYDEGQVKRLFVRSGYTNAFPKYGAMRRDSNGDRLFIDYESSAGSNMVAIVSGQSVRVKALRGFGSVNDAEEQVCWQDLREHRWHFVNSDTLPPNEHVVAASGAYVVIANAQRQWVALAETPKSVLISLQAAIRVERIYARNSVLDVFFFQSQAKGAGGNSDEVLHLVTYSLEQEEPKLKRRRIFPWASSVFDMDPDGKVAVFRPKQTYFAHGALVELDTGRRIQLGAAGDSGVFLSEPVIRRFRELSK